METIEQKVEKTINEKVDKKFAETLEVLEKASREFEKLVSEGLTSKRGYNLMTIDNKHSMNYEIN
jgi:hypothetical protein